MFTALLTISVLLNIAEEISSKHQTEIMKILISTKQDNIIAMYKKLEKYDKLNYKKENVRSHYIRKATTKP